jgi:hypothetical protein
MDVTREKKSLVRVSVERFDPENLLLYYKVEARRKENATTTIEDLVARLRRAANATTAETGFDADTSNGTVESSIGRGTNVQ